ncbi:Werner Syndrome-like exonuclease [Triticum dicoccoides]|uniref:Werner Syndrome-like exonuclease n=1 Tax=Triticum dicoccoides TaxID=85692 RepID=UPI00189164D2|nr:Werner Syndrome-like exonuclease [Triticum dicoccoides]
MAAEKLVTSVDFEDDVITATVTSSGDAVKAWLRQIRYVYRWVYHKLIVGLDVEWRPSYGRAQNPVALLQLCVGRRCLVFQLLHADFVPRALHRFLANPDFRFVGVGVQDDADRLSNDYGLEVANAVDLRNLAADEMRRPWLRQAGLKGVAGVVMGANLNKPRRVRMGPWDACRLSQEQIQYASIDAFVSFEVGRKLLTGDYSSEEEDY